MKILAIETSCDETAIAIVEAKGGMKNPSFQMHSNVVASQINAHAPFGGVVPNLAKREHEKNLPLVLNKAILKARVTPEQIDAIAITIGPGLAPALWTGVNFAKELARSWRKPIIPMNHMEGHIASVLLQQNRGKSKLPASPKLQRDEQMTNLPDELAGYKQIKFPALALLVSGGHTELVLMKTWKNKKIIGETRDDAAGEAFDKVARLLELGYPGGPHVAALAQHAQTIAKKTRNNAKGQRISASDLRESALRLPRPMLHTKDYNFSFSGLKTAVRYLVEKLKNDGIPMKKIRPAIAKEFQDAVVDVLVAKTIRAAQEYHVKTIILGGGVAANNLLRKTLVKKIKEERPEAACWMPEAAFAGDNAAMIAAAAYLFGKKKGEKYVQANANLR